MKLVNVVLAISLVSVAFASGGCKSLCGGTRDCRIAFQTDDCGEFVFEKCDVMHSKGSVPSGGSIAAPLTRLARCPQRHGPNLRSSCPWRQRATVL